MKTIIAASCAALAVMASSAHAAEVLVNGDFQQGLTGWTSYTTVNGTISEAPSTPTETFPQQASVAAFATVDGVVSDALSLNAGRISGFGAPRAGGGVSQTFTLAEESFANFTADIAAFYTRTSGVVDLGLFSVLIDGVVVASHDFGGANGGPVTLRDTLSFTQRLSAGQHTISLQSTRLFAPARGVYAQYFDNASLDVTAVPEPAGWALMIAGFGFAGMALRRRSALV